MYTPVSEVASTQEKLEWLAEKADTLLHELQHIIIYDLRVRLAADELDDVLYDVAPHKRTT